MLIASQTDYISEQITKNTSVETPLTVYVRGSSTDTNVSGGTVTIEILGEDGAYHTYDDAVFSSASVNRLYVHFKAKYRVVIAGMSSPVDVEIK